MNRPTKTTARAAAGLLACAAGAAALAAPVDLFSNAGSGSAGNPGIATGGVTASGVPAPGGMAWSELQATGLTALTAANATLGFGGQLASGGFYRLADNFTVPTEAGSGWEVTGLIVYAYQPGAAGPTPPFSGATLRLWVGGAPDAPGAAIVFGDTTTDRLVAATPANILRTASTAGVVGAPAASAPDQSRPVWAAELAVAPGRRLVPGTYWVDVQVTSADPAAEVFCVPVTVVGARSKAGPPGDAVQWRLAPPPALNGQWLPLMDEGKPGPAPDVPQELAFIVRGVAPCGWADIAATDGAAGADGTLDNGDFQLFFASFFAGCDAPGTTPCGPADIAATDGNPGADGSIDNGDFSLFFSTFFSGC